MQGQSFRGPGSLGVCQGLLIALGLDPSCAGRKRKLEAGRKNRGSGDAEQEVKSEEKAMEKIPHLPLMTSFMGCKPLGLKPGR